MVIVNDHYQSIGLSVSNQGALNVSRVSSRSALIFLNYSSQSSIGENSHINCALFLNVAAGKI